MKTREFNKLLAYIDDNITDKKPVMTIYSKSYLFTDETIDKIEGLKIDIIGNCVNLCLYWCYDRVKAKHGYKYNKIMDLFNSSYVLTFNQRDKLLNKLSEYIK